MRFLREAHAKAANRAIADMTAGMVRIPMETAQLAPRICGHCRGLGHVGHGLPCGVCGGSGTTQRFIASDPTHVVAAQGPSGPGQQRLVAVALADGRAGYVHVEGGYATCLYVPRTKGTLHLRAQAQEHSRRRVIGR